MVSLLMQESEADAARAKQVFDNALAKGLFRFMYASRVDLLIATSQANASALHTTSRCLADLGVKITKFLYEASQKVAFLELATLFYRDCEDSI